MTPVSVEKFKALLKRKGMKVTPQRLAVHEAMMYLCHASADMVCKYLADKGGTGITPASVYNTLTLMARTGIYHQVPGCGSRMYFDIDAESHVHLHSAATGEFLDINDDELCDWLNDRFRHRRFRGYKVDSIEVTLVAHQTRKTFQNK